MKNYTPNLVKIVKQIKDSRNKQGQRYSSQTIIWIVIIGTLLGESSLVCICELLFYNKKLRRLISKITKEKLVKVPHSTTISRALKKMNLENLLEKINFELLNQDVGSVANLIAGDGKVMRGIHDGSKRQILSFVNSELFPVFQVELENKENEITTFQKLLKDNKLKLPKKSLLTLDAIHTQVKTIKQLKKKDLDYLFKVKSNQKELRSQLIYIFLQGKLDKSYPLKVNIYKKFEKAHDRETNWKTTISTDFCSRDLPTGFESVKTIGFIETKTKRPIYEKYSGKKKYNISKNRTYFITSVTKTSKELFNIAKNHWRVEKLHWLKDTLYLEDKHTIKGRSAYFLTFIKSLSINLISRLSSKIAKTTRRLSLDYSFLNKSLKQLEII